MVVEQDLKELYENNEDFRRYVDRCAANCGEGRSAPVEEILGHALTRIVASYYENYRGGNENSTYTPQGECV